MWNIESKYLQDEEKIEYSDCPNKWSFGCIISYLWIAFMMFGAIFMLIGSATSSEAGLGFMVMLLYIAMALPAFIVILRRLSTRYAISNKGLLMRKGIITTNIKTVPFKHVTSIEVRETLFGKILHYAHLLIDTSGSGKEIEFRWNFVNSAHKVKKLIEKHALGKN
jgi:uncharacterized membrane protein YdbT with pleckstrin-like domain